MDTNQEVKITEENVTIENLGAVKYGDLKETLESLGVGQCWKPGTQRVVMVQNAIEKLAVIKAMRAEGKTQEEIDEALTVKADSKEEIAKAAKLKEAEEAEAKQAEAVKEVEAKELTKEQVEANIVSIDKNLKNGIPAQRDILLGKKKALLSMLEKFSEDSEE